MQISEPIDVFVGGQEGYHTYRIPAIVRTGDGDLLAISEARRESWNDAGKIDLVSRRSSDGGRTWQPMRLILGEAGDVTIGNPVPIVARDGTVHLVACRNNHGVFHLSSADHGRSWSAPRWIGDQAWVSQRVGFAVGRFGAGPCHGVQLPTGRLVVPLWVRSEQTDLHYTNGKSIATVLLSDDAGLSWRLGGKAGDGRNESVAVLCADGSLLFNSRSMRQSHPGYRQNARSTDGGESFPQQWIDQTLIDSNCQASAVCAGDGTVYFLNPAERNPKINYSGPLRKTLTLRTSPDHGQTWPTSQLIDAGPSGYSDMAFADHRTLVMLYERGQTDYRETIAARRVML